MIHTSNDSASHPTDGAADEPLVPEPAESAEPSEPSEVIDPASRGTDSPEYRRVVDVALHLFARTPFAAAKVSDISEESGMSKRMIYYYFGDKAGLYRAAYARAIALTRPPEEKLYADSNIPVDGIRQVAEATFDAFVAHPASTALLQMESNQRVLADDAITPIGRTPVLSQLTKLLMVGQDAGGFRPDVGAFDLYILICSLAISRVSLDHLSTTIYGVPLTNETNTAALRRMVVDTVLAFLTSSIPNTGLGAYLIADAEVSAAVRQPTGDALYEEDAGDSSAPNSLWAD